MDNIAAKINRANAIMSKIRHFPVFKILKLIYHPTFKFHVNYSLLVWAQNANSIKRHLKLLKLP